jgi:hypothetical protein
MGEVKYHEMNDRITIPPSRYSVPACAFQRVMEYLTRTEKPVYLGQIAISADCNLSQAAFIMEKLVGDEFARSVTKEEKISRGIDSDAKMFVIVSR